jgi:hypothetical protein
LEKKAMMHLIGIQSVLRHARRFLRLSAVAAMILVPAVSAAGPIKLLTRERIRVINMIPNAQSGETGQDSEPNLAVNPANVDRIVGTAFTQNPSGATNRAPIFVSLDRGNTWALNNIVPSGNGMTGDISVAFPTSNGRLYAGILRGGSGLRMQILRTADPSGAAVMDSLVDRAGSGVDQPWTETRSTTVSGASVDRVYVGNNDFNAANGRTASVEHSLNAGTAPAPAGFTTDRLEVRNTNGQDMPAIRTTVHSNGTVYAVFYRWVSGATPNARCDVVVVRDDNWASAGMPFRDLVDAGDGLAGVRVAQNVLVPAFPANLGSNRLVASNLSIAVDPSNAQSVWVAWADRVGTNDYTLHVRRSTDGGATWSADLLSVTNATNPALAVNSAGVVGVLYQQLTGTAPSQRWETRLRRSTTGSSWSNRLLANTPDNNPAPTFQPYLGDYADLVAVGKRFFGVFSASNIPDMANFPNGVTYQRNANFTTHTLLDTNGTTPVAASIDPFFFRVEPIPIFDICKLSPKSCVLIKLDPGRIRFDCQVIPCRVIDPIPKNCLVKFECPGCGPLGLCPPWYHIYLDGADPRIWQVEVLTNAGDPVPHSVRPTDRGVVVSFRPSRGLFKKGSIGDYVLAFESGHVKKGAKVTFRTRLETSSFPFDEHVKRRTDGRPGL